MARWTGRIAAASRVLAETVADVLWPRFCVLCGPLVAAPAANLCATCAAAIVLADPSRQCRVCAVERAARAAAAGGVCLACERRRPPYERLVAAGPYAGRLRDLVAGLKFGRDLACAQPLGRVLAAAERALRSRGEVTPPDLVCPMPITPARRRERGFNQVEAILRGAGRTLGAPVVLDRLERRGDGAPQVGKSRSARGTLGAAAFAARDVFGRRVLLVDDVVTTGATLRAASRALLGAGALAVRALVVARTP